MTLKIIKLSLRTIYNNKMRSFLTMLGIIIGVMAVVILVSITQIGNQRYHRQYRQHGLRSNHRFDHGRRCLLSAATALKR